MEIERKWLVGGWPEGLAADCVFDMEQGYISVRPTVRIRQEAEHGGRTDRILCFKGKGRLAREEIELEIDAEVFERLKGLPTVRIRQEAEHGGRTDRILCFKGKGRLAREEIELEIDAEVFERLKGLIGCPLIHKERRDYRLADGHVLEVNSVDPGSSTAFFYAEVEFDSEERAIGCPLIHKERRDYRLADGHVLEVNSVDPGSSTAFFYAEVEFDSEERARAWSPADAGLEGYLNEEVTEKKGVSMGTYWEETRHGTL